MVDIDRKLSEIALKDVHDVVKRIDDAGGDRARKDAVKFARKYKTLVKGFGSRIMNNTLLGAMAFLASKGEAHHRELFEDITKAVAEVAGISGWKGFSSDSEMYKAVLEFLSKEDVTTVMHVQELALRYISYLRRYVSAFIEGEDEEA